MNQSRILCMIAGIILTFFIQNLQAQNQNYRIVDGECYVQHIAPAEEKLVTKQVLVRPAGSYQETIPAVYGNVTEQVISRPESKKMVTVPAQFETVTEQVMVNAEKIELVPVPAVYETVTEQVVVREAYIKLVPVDPVFEEVTEQVLDRPESIRIVPVPAVYETVTERIIVKEASDNTPEEYYTVVKTVLKSPVSTREEIVPATYQTIIVKKIKTPATTREVVIPAEYKTITKQVVKTPATTIQKVTPAEYRSIDKKVVTVPATIREEIVPAKYQTLVKNVVTTPATTRIVQVDAEYKTVTENVTVKAGGVQWKRIICDEDMPNNLVSKIQRALYQRGYNPGAIDNVYGYQTKIALTEFQKANNLLDGHIDYETVSALGIDFQPTTTTNIPSDVVTTYGNTGTDNKKDITSTSGISGNNGSDPANTNSNTQKDDVASKGSGAVSGTSTMSSEEVDMVKEINLMRSNPRAYVKYVQEYIADIENGIWKGSSFATMTKSTGQELINELNKLGPLSQLEVKEDLYQVAIKHGEDMVRQGDVTHKSSDGSSSFDRIERGTDLLEGSENLVGGKKTVRESVMTLLVDVGIENRGHRKNLLNPIWTHSACRKVGQVGTWSNSWVQLFGKAKGGNSSSGNSSNSGNAGSGGNTGSSNSNIASYTGSSMSTQEIEMVKEINLMRSNPAAYIKQVQDYLVNMENEPGWDPSYIADEKRAAEELINELRNLGPLSQLSVKEDLYKVAIGHGSDLQKIGRVTHTGSDGSNPFDRIKKGTDLRGGNENLVGGMPTARGSVITLLVDNGVPGRGHRKTLLNPKWTHSACKKVGNVGNMPDCWVQLFGKE